MGRVTRVEITLALSWLLAAGCGGGGMQEGMAQETQETGGTTAPTKTTTPTTAAGSTGSVAVMRAFARIEPIMLAPAMSTAAPTTSGGAAGMASAAAAGTSASAAGASASAAGTGGKAAGGAGTSGTGMGAGYAAGSGGAAGASTAPGSAAGGTGGMSAASTSAAGTGATGMMAAAGMTAAATTPTSSAAGMGGAQAPASISGSATFASNANGVNLSVMVSGCQDGKEYPIHVHQGSSCESLMAQGAHWDMTRGEGIPNIQCGGRNGTTMVSRAKSDMGTAWSVGDGSATDVVGHVIVIHDADDPMQRIACGVIGKS